MKILVLDDNEPIRQTLAMVLEFLGHVPLLAETPCDAFRFFEQDRPDAMILDLTLGDEDGENVYTKLQERFGSVPPTLVLSAVHNAEDRIRNLSGVRFLSKPYGMDELSEKLKALVSIATEALPV